MIRLTLNAKSDPEIHLFNKSTILIGTDSSHVDLLLAGSSILPIHLIITEQDGAYYAINETNDPFVLIDDQPFKKKILQNGAQILIHEIEIHFEHLPAQVDQILPEESVIAPEAEQLLNLDLSFENEVEAFKDGEWDHDNLDRFLKEDSPPPKQEQKEERKVSASLKDDYLRELDDDNPNHADAFSSANDSSHLYQAWKWILLFIFTTISLSGIVGSIIFYSLSDKTEAQETKVAQGVADIAMALTHAHLHYKKPHNQNWSDVDFLKTNLQDLLPNSSSYASQIDGLGQFHYCPYNLRVYTNSDLSRFLLIAQPAPGLFYNLIPKSIIILDSESMELRSFKDLRTINRLLANTNPLDGVNGKEIFSSVKQGKLIRLSTLANESGHSDFAPPKNLAWIKPGAENAVYNAPRYYRLSQSLLQKAVALSTSKASSQEVTTLKQEAAHFSRLSNLILYSDSKKSAILSKQSLALFAPSQDFLFGHLLFDNQGAIHQVQLLKDEDLKGVVSLPSQDSKSEFIAMSQPEIKRDLQEKANHPDNQLVDVNHPIYIQLNALVTTRENELRPLSAALYNLLNEELDTPKAHFQTEFQNLFHTYMLTNSRHKHLIKETIINLYHQYEDMPVTQYMAFIKDLQLNHLILQRDDTLSLIDENCTQNLENICSNIKESQSLLELDNLVHIAFTWLNFDYLKDPRDLIKYQNLLRNHVLEQLNDFILTRKKSIVIVEGDKETLKHILDHERLIKPDEKDFFLTEFDELMLIQKASKRP